MLVAEGPFWLGNVVAICVADDATTTISEVVEAAKKKKIIYNYN